MGSFGISVRNNYGSHHWLRVTVSCAGCQTFKLDQEVCGVVVGGSGELDMYDVGLRRVDELLTLSLIPATNHHVARRRRLADLSVDVAQLTVTTGSSLDVFL